MGGVRDHRNGAARDRGLRLAASRRPALRFSGRAAAASSGACISETPFARAYCRAVSGTSPRAMQMASRAPRRSRSACNSRRARRRRAPPSSAGRRRWRRGRPCSGRNRRRAPAGARPRSRAGSRRTVREKSVRTSRRRPARPARAPDGARSPAAMMAITAKGMAANTPMAAYPAAARPPTLSSAAMAALIHQGERSAPRRWNSGAS